MSIPEARLQTWAQQGAVDKAQANFESVKRSLLFHLWPDNASMDFYLDGSYLNGTNTRSDVPLDIVAQLDSTFMRDSSLLHVPDRRQLSRAYRAADYTWSDYYHDVLEALRSYTGEHLIHLSDRAILVKGFGRRLDIHITVALQYRRYVAFDEGESEGYMVGMTYYLPSKKRWAVRYPKLHHMRGNDKDSYSRTQGLFKPMVRVVKNARDYMVVASQFPKGVAPSHFIESLVFNWPDTLFTGSLSQTLTSGLDWTMHTLSAEGVTLLKRQDGLGHLFGDGPDQWPEADARRFVASLRHLFRSW